MVIHKIHDDTDKFVMSLLESGFSKIEDDNLAKNYHPSFKLTPGNIFYILSKSKNRYSTNGCYYVLEIDGNFVCSAGWNQYELDSDIALLLTRMYTDPSYRMNYYHATHLLPKMLEETKDYKHQWVTMNLYNKKIYNWFLRKEEGKASGLFNNWPDIYRKFRPIGKKTIYYTEQYVAEYEA